ncbi:MAG: tRNA glutamyl-Q(34) synthetase GluQRS [Halothiobacillus sp.]
MSNTLRQPGPRDNTLYVGRFAPTPSGSLHLGSLVAALGSYLDAHAHGGQWRLRLDDLDAQRCQATTAHEIIRQLEAHGLEPDGDIIWQSQRLDAYQAALAQLNQSHEVYRCQCSRNTLRAALDAGALREGLAGPIYPGTCLQHPPAREQSAGWRFRVPAGVVSVEDRFLGELLQMLSATIGDPLLKRSDGVFAYHLAEVVDNQAMAITDVVRGADLAPLTPLHIALHQALFPYTPAPRYAHLPLVMTADGRKLSKTNHAPALNPQKARVNLIQAAQYLGLATPEPNLPIADLLTQWTTHWAQMWVRNCE